MKKVSIEIDRSSIKHAPRNPLDIPTGKLEKPLETGYEVYLWLKQNCFLTKRYAFRGRARGKGWYDSMPLDTAERIALYMDEKPQYHRDISIERDRLEQLKDIEDNIADLNQSINTYEQSHKKTVNIKTRS